MILVTTAGQVGSETARLLAQREVPVRVLVRDPEKAKTLAGVAAVAASIAASPAPPAGQTYWLTGPALISYYDVAAVLSKLLGRAVTYRELTFDQDKDTMIRAGVPEQIAERPGQGHDDPRWRPRADRRDERPGGQPDR
ncbi:MAG: hypothetical protein ABSA53_38065 [Streptosporangiaceae bacterium]